MPYTLSNHRFKVLASPIPDKRVGMKKIIISASTVGAAGVAAGVLGLFGAGRQHHRVREHVRSRHADLSVGMTLRGSDAVRGETSVAHHRAGRPRGLHGAGRTGRGGDEDPYGDGRARGHRRVAAVATGQPWTGVRRCSADAAASQAALAPLSVRGRRASPLRPLFQLPTPVFRRGHTCRSHIGVRELPAYDHIEERGARPSRDRQVTSGDRQGRRSGARHVLVTECARRAVCAMDDSDWHALLHANDDVVRARLN